MKPIAFGTDGWRAVIARDFTFPRVWAVATGYAEWLLANKESRPILVSFDARFLSEKFAAVAAAALAEKGISVSISDRPAITPAASYHVAANGLGGAAIITASHNPSQWNGFKIKTADGASAPTEITDPVRDRANALLESGEVPEDYDILASPPAKSTNLQTAYVERLSQLADLESIRRAGLKVVVDNMHAAGTGYLDTLLEKAGCQVEAVRAERNPLFGGVNPEPIEDNLGASLPLTRAPGVDVGFALDGDGDRLGIMAGGEFISTHRMMALLALHLLRNRKERGALVRTVNMTSMIDALAAHFKVPLLETPVGFKNVAKLMLSREVTIGGEESGGTGFAGHIPERDACLAALRICEFMATEGKSVPELLELLWGYVGGPHYFERLDVRLSQEDKKYALERLTKASPEQIAGKSVVDENSLDGRKFFLEDNAWLLIRPSGTEPLIRIYAEAKSQESVGHLLKAGENLVMGK
ncbi:MAG: phosphoglucomutase/phosphomannomutase family protein [Armatimonadetes bacterium]|nr:phosphoglucomutase/phosphomannomutase family protein [Armatimonadota bacterium]NIO75137.1 phosphoglucomutase/phosphomannomutase family protein [Armatimonadota bacterium]NIO95761.1 phosphoglucomutase/phosphomannomutase family protein [Armatimonadota bacterium]